MFTLGAVLSDVRMEHPAFDETRVPDIVLRAAFNNYQTVLLGKSLLRDKTVLAQTVVLSGLPATVDPTVPLTGLPPAGVYAIIGGDLVRTTGRREPLEMVSVGRRLETARTLTLLDGKLYQNGRDEDWRDIASIEVLYVPLPTPLQNRTDAFGLPDTARTAVVAHGVVKAARRCVAFAAANSSDHGLNVAGYEGEAARAEQAYLSSLRLSSRARVTTFREGDY